MFFNFLPFIVGRNIIETTLISKKDLYGFSLFDVKYFFAIYLSDLFLFLIYQNYFSEKFFSRNKVNKNKDKNVKKSFKLALISLTLFFILTLIRSLNHELGYLLFFASLIIAKYILVFSLIIVVDLKKYKQDFYQVIAASVFFQTIIIFIEQFRGGDVGYFIENQLPGLEMGTHSAESIDLLRANGTFNEPNITAIFLLMNVAILSHYAIKVYAKNQLVNYLYLGICLLTLLAIIFTGSRSLYALSLIFILYYSIKYWQKLKIILKKLWQHNLLKLAIFTSFILMLPYFLNRMNSVSNAFTSTGSLTYRDELNKKVLSMSYKNLLGFGLDLTPYYLAKNFKTVDSLAVIFDQAPAHNVLVQVIAETGILSFIIFTFFIYYSFKQGLKTKNQNFTMAALIYFIAAQFHPVFTNHYELTAFFFLYLGLGIHEKK